MPDGPVSKHKTPRKAAVASRSRKRSTGGGPQAKPRPRLTREAIVEAAVRLADEEGLAALSMRRLAAKLDVRPMSLYTHVSNKAELLYFMTEEVVMGILVDKPLPDDWREAVSTIARRMYTAFVTHQWFVDVAPKQSRVGPASMRLAKQSARALSSLEVEPALLWRIQATINDFVLGHAVRSRIEPTSRGFEEALSRGDLVEFPELSALPGMLRARASNEPFELGLRIVLDGVERLLLSLRAEEEAPGSDRDA